MTARPFPFAATICTVIGSIILCGLGTWQIQRLAWKTELLANLEREYAKDAVNYPLESDDFIAKTSWTIKRGLVIGRLQQAHMIAIHNGPQSYKIYVPLTLEAKGDVLVYLGNSDNKDVSLPLGDVTIVGLARYPSKPWRFGIKNSPETNQWVYLDTNDVAMATGLDHLSGKMVMTAETVTPPIDDVTPKPERYQPNNNHKQYAIFWFTMCIVMLVVYYKRFWSK